MQTRTRWALAGVGICFVLAALAAAAPGEQPKTRWEYKFVSTEFQPSNPEWSDGPNAWGAEGWELVSATADANKYVLYFKRPWQSKR